MIFPKLLLNPENVNFFVAELSPLVCNEYLRRKSNSEKTLLPSVCIAQAALESGWNINATTLFGIKGDGMELSTTEFINGGYVNIIDSFKKYPSITAAVQGYYDLIQWNNYDDATSQSDVEGQVNGLTNDIGYKYATDPSYKNKILSIINTFDLRVFDEYVLQYDYSIPDNNAQEEKRINIENVAVDSNTNVLDNIKFILDESSNITDVFNVLCNFWHSEYKLLQYSDYNKSCVLSNLNNETEVFGRFYLADLYSKGHFEYY